MITILLVTVVIDDRVRIITPTYLSLVFSSGAHTFPLSSKLLHSQLPACHMRYYFDLLPSPLKKKKNSAWPLARLIYSQNNIIFVILVVAPSWSSSLWCSTRCLILLVLVIIIITIIIVIFIKLKATTMRIVGPRRFVLSFLVRHCSENPHP